MNEVWKGLEYKDIDYSKNYEISNLGRIRNKHTMKILKTHIDKDGYVVINLREPGTVANPKVLKIHRLIMWNFVKKSDLEIDHKDMNKQNNSIDNLEYVEHIENQHRLYKSNKGFVIKNTLKNNCIKRRIKVKQYDLDDNFIKEYESILDAANNTPAKTGAISRCLTGKNRTAGGYKWKYA